MIKNQLTAFVSIIILTTTANAQPWLRNGNAVTTSDFLGTTNALPLNIKTLQAQPINFQTNNLRAMRIDGTGRISISNAGVSTYQKLYVETGLANDGIQVKQIGTSAATLDLFASSTGGKRWAFHSTGSNSIQGAGHLLFWDWTSNVERLRINSNGYIGIGTEATPLKAPYQKLHIHNGAILISGTVPGVGGPQLIFTDNLTTHPAGRWAIEYMTADATRPTMGGLNFWTPFNSGGVSGTAGNYSLFLKDNGKVGMGVTDDNTDPKFCASAMPGSYRLYVNGGILTTKVKIAIYCAPDWADYVFEPGYKLPALSEIESFVKINRHLPDIPSVKELIQGEGIDVQEMLAKQMAKIEELTLYIIEQDKRIKALEKKLQN